VLDGGFFFSLVFFVTLLYWAHFSGRVGVSGAVFRLLRIVYDHRGAVLF